MLYLDWSYMRTARTLHVWLSNIAYKQKLKKLGEKTEQEMAGLKLLLAR